MVKKCFTHWPTITDLASAFDVPYPTAQSWVRRGFIPAPHDHKRITLIEQIECAGLSAEEKLDLMTSFAKERESAAKKKVAA